MGARHSKDAESFDIVPLAETLNNSKSRALCGLDNQIFPRIERENESNEAVVVLRSPVTQTTSTAINTVALCPLHDPQISEIALPLETTQQESMSRVHVKKGVLWTRLKSVLPDMDNVYDTIDWINKGLWIVFPPVPSWIIQKAAFHPPKRGEHYFLIAGPPNERLPVFCAKEAKEKGDPQICLRMFLPRGFLMLEIAAGLLRIQTHIIENSIGNHIVLIHVRCRASIIANAKSPKIMISSQPNSSDLGGCSLADPTFVEIANSLNCDIIGYDYSGYGCSTGFPSQTAIYADIEAVYEYVTKNLGYDDADIILFGFSMGTAASIHLASIRNQLCGMVLVAPFTSLLRIVGKTNSSSTCCWDQFSNYDKAACILTRTLICHGMSDAIVGTEHSEVLRQRLKNTTSPFYVPNATHRGIYGELSMWTRIKDFFNDELGVNDSWMSIVGNRELLNETHWISI